MYNLFNLLKRATPIGETSLKVKRAKSTSTVGHYVTNGVLLPAVIEAKELGKVTDKLIRMIQMIAERYSRKSNFIGYSFREDMVSAAVMNLCNNALKFKPEKSSNPFSFYTTAIHNSFLQYMADEKKHRNIRDALLIDAGSNPSFNFLEGEKDESHFEIKESDEVIPPPEVRGIDQEDLPVAIQHVEGVEPPAAKVRHAKWIARDPGPCVTYGPGDIDIDPVTGAITIKEKPQPVIVKPRKKKVETVEVNPLVRYQKKQVENDIIQSKQMEDDVIVKKPRAKKIKIEEAPVAPVKKTRAKKLVDEVLTPVKKTRAKKEPVEEVPVKKPRAKKISAPAVVEKKTPKKKSTAKAK